MLTQLEGQQVAAGYRYDLVCHEIDVNCSALLAQGFNSAAKDTLNVVLEQKDANDEPYVFAGVDHLLGSREDPYDASLKLVHAHEQY